MGKIFNPNRIKKNRNYTVVDVKEALGAHPKTVRNWIHAGLLVIDETRPLLIQGADLKVFLQQKRTRYQYRCELKEMPCLKCSGPKVPSINSVQFITEPPSKTQMKGRCHECGCKVNKLVSEGNINQIWTELGGKLPLAEKHLILIDKKRLNFPFGEVFNDEKK